jgi:hypothetical protein
VHVVEHRSARSAPPGASKHLRGPVRLLRGWAAAVVATLLAAGSHTLAGYDAGPAPVVWLLTLALAGPLCTALAGRSLSWWRLWSAVGSSQLLFHWLYSQSAARPGDPGAAAPSLRAPLAGAGAEAAHAGHAAHAGGLRADTLPGPETLSGPETLPATEALSVAGHLGLVMVAAHVLAVVATVLLLRRGEAMAVRVVQLGVGLVLRSPGARLSRWVPALRPPRLPSRPLAPAVRAGAVVLSGLRWRGPPVPVLSP